MKTFMAAIILTAFVTPLAAQWLHHRTPGIPRTADGKPDLAASPPRTADGKPDVTGLWEVPLDTAVCNIAVRNVGDLKPDEILPWARLLTRAAQERKLRIIGGSTELRPRGSWSQRSWSQQ
jgi:hypothetical protein